MSKYKCNWPDCDYEFEAESKTSNNEKHSRVSDAIICPRCKNWLKVEDGYRNETNRP